MGMVSPPSCLRALESAGSLALRSYSRPADRLHLLEFIEPTRGRMLSETWDAKRHDPVRRRNLFQGLARIILSVARFPQVRIGSLTFRDDGTVSLSNRPLSCSTMILESSGASRVMARDQTYPCAEPYISDLLTQHDGRLLAQTNAVRDDTDCHYQLAVHGLLRMISHHYLKPRSQPFAPQFTDLHQSNIFVDDDWNITALVDLEWMGCRPLGMIDVPYWITLKGIDEVGDPEDKQALKEYTEVREEFLSLLGEEEEKLVAVGKGNQHALLSHTLRSTGASGSNWFFWCLDSINAMYNLFEQHIQPRYHFNTPLSPKQDKLLSQFWSRNTDEVVKMKRQQRETWLAELRAVCEGGDP